MCFHLSDNIAPAFLRVIFSKSKEDDLSSCSGKAYRKPLFISEEISTNTYVNIMDQYYPCYKAYENPPLNRGITGREYSAAIQHAIRAGLRRLDGVAI
jgi:uncharacterized Fe-S radical SAM superfamily protein PflX